MEMELTDVERPDNGSFTGEERVPGDFVLENIEAIEDDDAFGDDGFADPRGSVGEPRPRINTAETDNSEAALFSDLPSYQYAANSIERKSIVFRNQKRNSVAPADTEWTENGEGRATEGEGRSTRARFISRSFSDRRNRNRVRFAEAPLRRTSSFPEQIDSLDVEINIFDNLHETGRTSTLPLATRIDCRRHAEFKVPQQARVPCWGNFRDIYWPKVTSRLKGLLSWQLWSYHLKVVEGRFGTAVVSYFVFLKYLFLMNLLMFLIWTCFVSVPHFIWRGSPSGVTAYENSTTSQLTCLLGLDQLPGNTSCTSYCGGIHVVSDCPQNTSTFPSSDCSVVDGAVFWTSGTAKSVQVESVTCLNSTEYCLCRSVPVAATEWYQHIIDFITGQGLFNTTVLFIGQYHNGRINEVYDMPVAYLLTAGWLYVLSITIIVWRMGVAFGDSYTRLVYGSKIDYCNKVFTAWDFNVTDRKASRLKREAIKTELQETLIDQQRKEEKRSCKDLAIVILIRIFSNIFVLATLAGGGAAIYYAVQYSTEQRFNIEAINTTINLAGLVSPIVISILNISLPKIYYLLAHYEHYKTKSGIIKVTLFRAIVVRLASLMVLVASLFSQLRCTQPASSGDVCTAAGALLEGDIDSDHVCTQCWETLVGQELYSQAVFTLALNVLSTIAADSAKKLLSLFLNSKCIVRLLKGKRFGDKIPLEFDIPTSILDVIYAQALFWLGFFFSPFLPFITTVHFLILFYVKRYSVTINLKPWQEGQYRAARTNFTYLLLLLLTLLAAMVPVGFAIGQLTPSQTCGPFRNQAFLYSIIEDRIDELACEARAATGFLTSLGFIIPLIMFFMMSSFGLALVARSRGKSIKLLEKQLSLESSNANYLMGKLFGEEEPRATDSVFTILRKKSAKSGMSKARQHAPQRNHGNH